MEFLSTIFWHSHARVGRVSSLALSISAIFATFAHPEGGGNAALRPFTLKSGGSSAWLSSDYRQKQPKLGYQFEGGAHLSPTLKGRVTILQHASDPHSG